MAVAVGKDNFGENRKSAFDMLDTYIKRDSSITAVIHWGVLCTH